MGDGACAGDRAVVLRSTENNLIIGSGMSRIRFHKIWVQQCRATRGIKRRFGVKSALDYLIGEKLMDFADAAQGHPEFAAELPRFQAAVWNIFNPYELAGYLSSLKPSRRKSSKSFSTLTVFRGSVGQARPNSATPLAESKDR